MNNEESNQSLPIRFKGKWLIILLAPLIIIISIWLMYLRVTFKHPTNVMPASTANKAP